ncbi:hypothetical protein D9613_010219 [Agrocybe pediades]|uniref:Uncharacterized protein n=1 Tax=Agrocybe pediades TaxID=84607 RepID=A0A8H4VJG2_9AGAR|nr:hypothetical protein D9613_010219 [Agrocybe pediades]
MSAADNFPYSVAQQKALISSDFNSTLIIQFSFGIYTGVFAATMYFYIHKENRTRARDVIIIGTTTALYILTAVNILVDWLYTNILLVAQGGTRVEIFLESTNENVPLGERILGDLTFFFVFLFADGLLVWRCFHACGRSLRKSILPISLFLVETALAFTTAVYSCLVDAKPSFETNQNIDIFNHLSAATLVVVVVTSLVSTAVICLQIWRHTRLGSRSKRHYKTIINALIESSALYTVTVLFSAVVNFINTSDPQSSFSLVLVSYFVAAATMTLSGLAPTLMIARLAISSNPEDAEDSESARLPSDLIGRESYADLEVQQRDSNGVVEVESNAIQVLPNSEYRGPAKDELEDHCDLNVVREDSRAGENHGVNYERRVTP